MPKTRKPVAEKVQHQEHRPQKPRGTRSDRRPPQPERESSLSNLELMFLRTWENVLGLKDRPQMQYVFHPTRKWRFDFAWPEVRVAVEIDGGIFVGGGHNRGVRFSQDADKHNEAVLLGWRLLRFTTVQIRGEPVQCIDKVRKLIADQRGLPAPSPLAGRSLFDAVADADDEPF